MRPLQPPLCPEALAAHNSARIQALHDDFDALSRMLGRRGIEAKAIKARVAMFEVALPTWGAGTGGTRFARFPIAGEPTNIHQKLEDCAVVHQLCRITPRVSAHLPWDRVADPAALREEAEGLGLGFDAINSNVFQDRAGQSRSYKFGSLSHTDEAVRAQAIEHNLDCIHIGQALGSRALTVWIGDGTNFPGQQSLDRSFDRYMQSLAAIYAALPDNWRMLLEHKLFEPAFYSTVLSDWGSSILAAQELGDRAQCLVDLGHHAPSVNIEQIVARLHRFGKLGGFHFNDSKYGDDDLDAGAINPHQLFLVFNELVEAEQSGQPFGPAYMIDASHNVTDPVESMIASAEAIAHSFAKAFIVNRDALTAHQQANDVMMAFQELRHAYNTDLTPLVALARYEAGGAIDPIAAYRESGWRMRKARERKPASSGAGIV